MKSKSSTQESPSQPKVLVACPNMGTLRTSMVVALLRMTLEAKYSLAFQFSISRPIDNNRNKVVRAFLKTDRDYLFMIDSDVVPEFNPLDLMVLDLDVVTLLYPIWKNTDLSVEWCVTTWPDGKDHETECGLIAEIASCGAGALLIARRVLEHPDLKVPFKTRYDEKGMVHRSEDLTFCDKVWEAGFKVWAALDYKCTHEKIVDLRAIGNMQGLAIK